MDKICLNCKKKYSVFPSRKESRFCSASCYYLSMKGRKREKKIYNVKWKTQQELENMSTPQRYYWQNKDLERKRNYEYQLKARIGNLDFLAHRRKEHIRGRYGENALTKITELKGKCEKCDEPCINLSSWKSLHRFAIHHIDFDEKNNSLANLSFLCMEHHNDIHHFIPKEYRIKFFEMWLSENKN